MLADVTYAQLFLAYLGRPMDDYGIVTYGPPSTVIAYNGLLSRGVRESPEAQSLGGSGTLTARIDAVYQRLFNRGAEAAAITYWSGEVAAQRVDAAYVELAILQGAQNADRTSIDNKLAAAAAFVAANDTVPEKTYYAGAAAAAVARNFLAQVSADPATLAAAQATANAQVGAAAAVGAAPGSLIALTPGVDTADTVSSNGGRLTTAQTDVVVAIPGTTGNGDRIDAGPGNDILAVLGGGTVDTRGGLYTGIEEVQIGGAFTLVDVSGVQGFASLIWVGFGKGVLRGMPSSTAVRLENWVGGEGSALEYSDRAQPGSQVVDIVIGNSFPTALSVPGIEDVHLTLINSALTRVLLPDAISVTFTSSGIFSFHGVTMFAPQATRVILSAERGSLIADLDNLGAGAAVTLTGAASLGVPLHAVNVGANVGSFESTGTGNTDLTFLGNTTRFQGGNGVDRVTLAAGLGTANLNGGAGNFDTVVLRDTSSVTAATRGVLSGFEYFEIAGKTADASLLPGLGLAIGPSSNAQTVTNARDVFFSTSQFDGVTLNVADTGNADTLHILLDNNVSLYGLTGSGMETLRITTVSSTLPAGQTGIAAGINGLGALAASSLQRVVIDGSQPFNINTGNLGRAMVFDGSQLQAAMQFDGFDNLGALTVSGGAGSDYIRLSRFADTAAGGGGGRDLFRISAADFMSTNTPELLAAGYDSITDWGNGPDRLFLDRSTSIVDHAGATAGIAALSGGFASFAAADDTLVRKLVAVEAAINAGAVADGGQTGVFFHAGDAYVFVSNGIDGINAGDQLIRLVGVTSTAQIVFDQGIASQAGAPPIFAG